MTLEGVKSAHVEGLLSLYNVLSAQRLDLTTVVSTFRVPEKLVEVTFEACVCEGYLRETDDGLYELTGQGEEKIESMMVRRGSVKVVLPDFDRAPS